VPTGVTVTDDGAELLYVTQGGGRTALVLCHGGPGMWDYLEPVADMLNDIATVVRFDQRACGRSSGCGPYTVARFVADLESLRVHLACERWIVGGHSWGATLALAYACAHPDRTQAVVYVSGTGIGSAWNRAYHEEADLRRTAAQRTRLAELNAVHRRDPQQEREWRLLSWFPDFSPSAPALALATASRQIPGRSTAR
jgi:proline iminopeptidase